MKNIRCKRLVTVLFAVLIIGLSGCEGTGGRNQYADDITPKRKIAKANVGLGVGYMQQGNNDVALSKLERAIRIDPELPSAHYAIALLYERLGQKSKAEEHYLQAISLKPQYSEALNGYGVFLCNNKKIDMAEEYFMLALKNPLYKTKELVYANAGQCARRNGDLVKAEKHLRNALQINPKYPVVLLQMAYIGYESGRPTLARAYLERLTKVAQHTSQSLWLAIQVERELGDKDAVASDSMLLKSKFPDSEEVKLLHESERNERN